MQSSHFLPPMMDIPWTSEEHNLFLQGYLLYGKSWIEIAEVVRTRNVYQVCSYANWLDQHGCLPRLPPIQQAVSVPMQMDYAASSIQQSEPSYTAAAAATVAPTTTTTVTKNKGVWSKEEHDLFVKGLEIYGAGKWSKIASIVKTRDTKQVHSHGQTYMRKLQKTDGSVSGTKRKAPAQEAPKATTTTATTISTQKQTATKETKQNAKKKAKKDVPQAPLVQSSSPSSEATPASSPPSVADPLKIAKSPGRIKREPIQTTVEASPTLDIVPPSIKTEGATGKENVSPPNEVVSGKTENGATKPEETFKPSLQITHDPKDVQTVSVVSSLFDSERNMPMIAMGILVSILLAGTIFVYIGCGMGGSTNGEENLFPGFCSRDADEL